MNDSSKKTESLTLSELFSFIWARKIFVGIISIAAALILTLTVIFINPKLELVSFDLQVSFRSDNAQSYPNKDFYNYLNVVDHGYLRDTVGQNPGKYDNVNINELVDEDHISVSLLENTIIESGNTVNQTLQIKLKTSFFKSNDQAQDFIKDLVTTFESQVKLKDDYQVVESFIKLTDAESSTYTYQDVLFDMENEYIQLLNHYDKLIALNNGLIYRGSGTHNAKGILQIRQILEQRRAELGTIKHLINSNGYYKNKDIIETRISVLTNEVAVSEEIIKVIQASTSSNTDMQYLTKLIQDLVAKKQQLEYLTRIIDEPDFGQQKLANEITGYTANINELEYLTRIFNNLYRSHLNSRVMIRFINNKNGVSSGSISPVLAVIGGLILGFGIASVLVVNSELKKKSIKTVKTVG